MSLPIPQDGPLVIKSSYNTGEFMQFVVNALAYLIRGSGVAPGTITPESFGSNVFAQPVRATSLSDRGDLSSDPEFVIPASALHAYISNTSEDNVLYVKYGTGASAADFDRIVNAGGEIQVNDFVGTVSVAGTAVTGRFAVIG